MLCEAEKSNETLMSGPLSNVPELFWSNGCHLTPTEIWCIKSYLIHFNPISFKYTYIIFAIFVQYENHFAFFVIGVLLQLHDCNCFLCLQYIIEYVTCFFIHTNNRPNSINNCNKSKHQSMWISSLGYNYHTWLVQQW